MCKQMQIFILNNLFKVRSYKKLDDLQNDFAPAEVEKV